MDHVTAILLEITNADPTCAVDLEKIRNDVEAIIQKQGNLSEYGIKVYSRQYIEASKAHGFGVGNIQVIDWNTDYTADGKQDNPSEDKTIDNCNSFNPEAPTRDDLKGEEEPEKEFPTAKPDKKQHTHFDFIEGTKSALGLLGGMLQVNQNGTEFELVSVEGLACDEENPAHTILQQAKALDPGGFSLAERALEMSSLFRVNREIFNPENDRENEIRYHMIRSITNYDGFRSFAWTLAAYCDMNGIEPGKVDYATLKAIAQFVRFENNLNFTSNDRFCPTLSSGDDLHVYYLPDTLIKQKGDEILSLVNQNVQENGNPCGVASLEGLRRDLQWLSPAMDTIYRKLSENRDEYEPLCGDTADVLYAWCSVCSAAAEPIFSEDGPMNYAFDYPGELFGAVKKRTADPSSGKFEAKTNEKIIRTFSYDNHYAVRGSCYSLEIPDGFAVQENTEGRKYIAWLKNESVNSWEESSFIIFDGQKYPFEIADSFATEEEYEEIGRALGNQFESGIGALFEENRIIDLRNPLFPGVAVIQYVQDSIHANALGGVPGGIQLIRLQISGVERKDREAYDEVIRAFISHAKGEKALSLLQYPDDPEFLNTELTETWIEKWKALLENRLDHYANARQIGLNVVTSAFQNKPDRSISDIPEFKQNLRKVLKRSGDRHDELLRRCETVYQIMKKKASGSPLLVRIYDQLEAVAEQASHILTLNGDENNTVTYNSEYAAALGARTGETGRLEALRIREDNIQRTEENIRKLNERQAKISSLLQSAEKNLEEDQKKRDVLQKQQSDLQKLQEEIDKNEAALKAEREREAELSRELSSLGLFAMAAKKEIKQKIGMVHDRIGQINNQIDESRKKIEQSSNDTILTSLKALLVSPVSLDRKEWKEYQEQLLCSSDEINKALSEEEKILETLRSDDTYPHAVADHELPDLPSCPEIQRVNISKIREAVEDPLLPAVIRVMRKHTEPILLSNMMNEDPALNNASFMHVELLIDTLINAGLAEKIVMQRKKHYRLV